jgi:hypothetical protein
MQRGNYEPRAYAVLLLKSLLELAEPMQLIRLETELFIELVQVLHDQISQQASNAVLKLLIQLCPWGRNRVKAVNAGAVTFYTEHCHCHCHCHDHGHGRGHDCVIH